MFACGQVHGGHNETSVQRPQVLNENGTWVRELITLMKVRLTINYSISTPARSLRSAEQHFLVVPRSRLKQRGDWAFAVAAQKLWNRLPCTLGPLLN